MSNTDTIKVVDRRRHGGFIVTNDLVEIYGSLIGVIGVSVFIAIQTLNDMGEAIDNTRIANLLAISPAMVASAIEALEIYELI
ncbi:MAG: hypothetical protein HXX08_11090 [Chloroflexi bacterium]|uniref:Uncharacterized protein n=1 Tax=Candidatus Chlorohelix allophototropha TaxID=3003348 RepID=A0A8T7LZA2_9CHLR|nr:hypothetical protein [Chloroflexota bacterium]WJW65781.1 hypothetical protein OZ401_001560 [Chloroflexota bacterium L227-S17]